MSEEEAKVYLGAINASMSSPNMILDLRIPQNQKYQQVVLDEAISRFLAGEIDEEATVKAVTDGWNELNEEIGIDEQLELLQGDDRRQVSRGPARRGRGRAGPPPHDRDDATPTPRPSRRADLGRAASTATPAGSWCCRR